MAKQGSDGSPIFVVGTPRSGTTLTARVLGNHSRIFMPAETHFFDDIYARRRTLGEPGHPAATEKIVARLSTLYIRQHEGGYQKRLEHMLSDRGALQRLVGQSRDYRDVLSGFMEMQMRQAGKARWGNQVPRDIFNIPAILSFYPNAKIFVCVRDIRDFLLSYSGMKSVVRPKHAQRHRQLYHPILTSLLWTAAVNRIPAIKRQVAPENLMVVRYEDLVTQPEAVAKQMCRIAGEAFEPEMLAVQVNNSSDGSTRDRASGIFDSSVAKWRDALPPEHAYLAQKFAGRRLGKLGYRAEPITANPARLGLLLLTFPIAVARGLYANRSKQGPLGPYIARRAVSLLRPSPR